MMNHPGNSWFWSLLQSKYEDYNSDNNNIISTNTNEKQQEKPVPVVDIYRSEHR